MWKNPLITWGVWGVCLTPFLYLSWRWFSNDLGINSIEYVSRFTGKWALRMLLICLAITPLRRIPGLAGVIAFRRMTGLFAFFYGTIHMLHYFGFDAQWNWLVIGEDLTFRRFFIAGAVAWSFMLPLAVTSTNGWVRRLGGKRWQRLHRLIYLSAIAAIVHYVWQGKSVNLDPLIYAGILFVLLALRVVFAIQKRARHRSAVSPARVQT